MDCLVPQKVRLGSEARHRGRRESIEQSERFVRTATGQPAAGVCVGTGSSDSSGAETSVHSPGSPHPSDRNPLLHTLYKNRGNSLSELRDSSFYCITQADAASSDGERPRSTSATVRSTEFEFGFDRRHSAGSATKTAAALLHGRFHVHLIRRVRQHQQLGHRRRQADLNPPPHPITFKQIIPHASLFINVI